MAPVPVVVPDTNLVTATKTAIAPVSVERDKSPSISAAAPQRIAPSIAAARTAPSAQDELIQVLSDSFSDEPPAQHFSDALATLASLPPDSYDVAVDIAAIVSDNSSIPGVIRENLLHILYEIGLLSSDDRDSCTVEFAIDLGTAIETSLRQLGVDLAQHVRQLVCIAIIKAVAMCSSEDAVLVCSHLLLCLCRDSKPTAHFAAALIVSKSALCTPALFELRVRLGAESPSEEVQHIIAVESHTRFVFLLGSLIASSKYSSIFSRSVGWIWLVRMGRQFHHMSVIADQYKDDNAKVVPLMKRLALGCRAVRSFLRAGGRTILLEYGTRSFDAVLDAIVNVCTSVLRQPHGTDIIADVRDLNDFLSNIRSTGKCPHISLKSQPPYIIAARALTRYTRTHYLVFVAELITDIYLH